MTKTIGFLKKVQMKKNIFIHKIKNILKGEESKSIFNLLLDVLTSGILLNLAFHLPFFGIPISFMYILGFGSFYWFYANKFDNIVRGTIGSLCLSKTFK